MRARILLLIAAVGACSGPGQTQTQAAPTEPAPKVERKRGALAAGEQLYARGKPFTRVREEGDRFTCRGTPDDEKKCQAVRGPGFHCVLESPVGYWEGEIRCKGTRMTDWEREERYERRESLSIPRCVCGCTDEYARAAEALRERIDTCSRVP